MEMAGIVCYTGANIITRAREIIEQIGYVPLILILVHCDCLKITLYTIMIVQCIKVVR